MTTEKQIAANRRNALKSTGPRTKRGKKRSAQNARKHGLTAKLAIHPRLEDKKQWNRFLKAIRKVFTPRTALEKTLVLRIATALWRLDRILLFETQTLDREFLRLRDSPPHESTPSNSTPDVRHSASPVPESSIPLSALIPKTPDLKRIIRYERHIQLLFHRDLRELQQLREERANDQAAEQ